MKRFLIISILSLFSISFAIRSIAEDKVDYKSEFKPSYMGTVEAGHIFPWSHFLRVTHGMVSLTTSHGVLLKPWLFAGAGLGALTFYHKDAIGFKFPIFLNGRLTFPIKHFRPFFDLKSGVILPHYIFFNPVIGYKFAWGKKGGVRLSLGAYIFTSRSFEKYNGIQATLGFDF